ncbi:MAG TPA: FAD-binding oxidoreductase [Candidatus Obscuribacter sp.]|nr:FAD-binding oxidoreductase [Candidatus Obscuribacter sp.]HNG75951.1 FAD-binding oxidoreductase [Candidatus Obscuribacter sp.]HNH72810.1 FAD-binding oxidoreductase [Candidatus Obscuribacter sp.]
MTDSKNSQGTPSSGAANFTAGKKDFLSFDGGVRANGVVAKPSSNNLKDFVEIEHKLLKRQKPRIPMGAGLSFGAPQFGDGVVSVDHTAFTRVLGFDDETGLVEVESGATMAHLYNFLIEKERYIVTQPGYPSITVGGCIAVDVHGKNHLRDGTCVAQVASLKLYHPAYGIIEASSEVNREVFDLTCGGYGLTGHILSAKLKTKPVTSRRMALMNLPFDDVSLTPRMLKECARNNDFVVSWHDMTASGAGFGRGFLMMGKFFPGDGSDEEKQYGGKVSLNWGLNAYSRRWPASPLLGSSYYSLPFTRFMNVFYGSMSRSSQEARTIAIYDCLQPMTRLREFYYRMFGLAGFHECQLIIPDDKFPLFLEQVEFAINRFEIPITLGSAKYFSGSPNLLRFNGSGVCFALNFPRCTAGARFIEFIDRLCLEEGFLPYIVKDSRLPLSVVEHCYGEHYHNFKKRLKAFDPERLFQSEVSRRLAL